MLSVTGSSIVSIATTDIASSCTTLSLAVSLPVVVVVPAPAAPTSPAPLASTTVVVTSNTAGVSVTSSICTVLAVVNGSSWTVLKGSGMLGVSWLICSKASSASTVALKYWTGRLTALIVTQPELVGPAKPYRVARDAVDKAANCAMLQLLAPPILVVTASKAGVLVISAMSSSVSAPIWLIPRVFSCRAVIEVPAMRLMVI